MSAPGITSVGATKSGPNAATTPIWGTNPVTGLPNTPPILPTDQSKAAAIDLYIKQKNPSSPLVGQGINFVKAAKQYNVDPSLLVGIAGAETGFGSSKNTGTDVTVGHNPFGLGPHMHFLSYFNPTDPTKGSIQVAAATLAKVGQGATTEEALAKWVNGPNSSSSVRSAWLSSKEGQNYLAAVQNAYASLGGHINPAQPLGQQDTTGAPIATGVGPSIVSAISGPLNAIGEFISWITDPSKWLRLGEMILGVAALGFGAFSVIKGRAVLGLGLAMVGYLFLFAGIKNVSPIKEIQDAFQGK